MIWVLGYLTTTVPFKILASANLPKHESHLKFAQTFKGCNSRSGIIFVEDMSFYGKTFSFNTKKLGHFQLFCLVIIMTMCKNRKILPKIPHFS